MPCPWSRRCRAANTDNAATNALPSPTTSSGVEDWKRIRRYNLRMMRKQVRSIVLLMALMEAMRVGPMQIVYAGRQGYPPPGDEDFGIAYTMGYFISWLYVCFFMVIFVPLFSWWVPNTPSDPEHPSFAAKLAEVLKKLNLVLLPLAIGISLAGHVYYTLQTFIYVDSRPFGSMRLPKNTRKNWLVRFFMLLGVVLSTTFGYGAFQILADMDLAHVKKLEYAIIVVPVQVNLGILYGTLLQFRMEKMIAKRQALKFESVKVEEGMADEKAALLEV